MSEASDMLRRPAKVLREHAEATTQGRWAHDGFDVYETHSAHGDIVAEAGLVTHDARYIALMDPTVGLALADWLDAEAVVQDMMHPVAELLRAKAKTTAGDVTVSAGEEGGEIRVMGDSGGQAQAVARAVLREDERHD